MGNNPTKKIVSVFVFVTILLASLYLGTSSIFALSPPSQAIAVGYTNLAFSDDFDGLSTINTSLTGQAGYNWYPQDFFGSPTTPINNITVKDSVLKLSGPSWSKLNSATLGDGPYNLVGNTFGGGAYFEARIAFDLTQKDPNIQGWPAFWALSAENAGKKPGLTQWPGQPAGYEHFGEIDFMEKGGWEDTIEAYTGAAHVWYGIYNQTCNPGFCDTSNSPWGKSNFNNYLIQTPKGTNFNEFHTYGTLWVPAKGDNLGYLQYYFDGQATPTRITWSGTPQTPPPDKNPWAFSVLDQNHYVLTLQTGGGMPMSVDWVRVYQRPTTIAKPGDSNGDNKVDGVDYMIWLNNYNQASSAGYTVGDYNDDGIVNILDYNIWRENYGK